MGFGGKRVKIDEAEYRRLRTEVALANSINDAYHELLTGSPDDKHALKERLASLLGAIDGFLATVKEHSQSEFQTARSYYSKHYATIQHAIDTL